MSNNSDSRDPVLQSMLQESYRLPDSAARDALRESIASRAEALGDIDTAWSMRCAVLSSTTTHNNPRIQSLFLNLAWCLAVHDRAPDEFNPQRVLWSYKWVATDAPRYASVPTSVLHRLIDDMDARFLRAGWGGRAGLHKRLELAMLTGNPAAARELLARWSGVARDRGSDCAACEANTVVDLHTMLGDAASAVRHAQAIIGGRLSCTTVPHSTFGLLLGPLTSLGRTRQADELYQRGRRLVASMAEGGCTYATPYILYAARRGDLSNAAGMLRTRLRQAVKLQSDADRLITFGPYAVALTLMSRQGDDANEWPPPSGFPGHGALDGELVSTGRLAEICSAIALAHARALDLRNGNNYYAAWLARLAREHGVDQVFSIG